MNQKRKKNQLADMEYIRSELSKAMGDAVLKEIYGSIEVDALEVFNSEAFKRYRHLRGLYEK